MSSGAAQRLDRVAWARLRQAMGAFLASPAAPSFVQLFGLLIAFLVGINALNVLNSYVGRDFISAIENRDRLRFVSAAWQYLGVFAVSTVAAVLYRYLEERLALLWREWQTRKIVDGYLARRSYLRLEQQGRLQNPDQRIAEDIRSFVGTSLSFVLMMLNAAFTVIAFSGVLWSISPQLFGVAVAYALAGSLLTALLGKRLVKLNVLQLDREAYLRADLLQLRDHAESVALMQGEPGTRRRLLRRLGDVVANTRRMIAVNRNLGFFTNGYNYLIQMIPALIVAPLFMRGEVQFGVVTQSAMAFTHLMGAFSLAVTQFQSISSYAAVIARLSGLVEALDGPDPPSAVEPQPDPAYDAELAFEGFTLFGADGRLLVDRLDLRLRRGCRVLVTGASGHAKLGLLRAASGLPCASRGSIRRGAHAHVLTVPEHPYLPRGSLRQLLASSCADAPADAEMLHLLHLLQLQPLIDQCAGLDPEHDWSGIAGPGEQVRLAIATALLARPDLLFLDRLHTVLDPAQVQQLLGVLRDLGVGYLLLGKPGDAADAFDSVLQLQAEGRWELQPARRAAPVAA